MKFQAIKGVRDILPPDSALWGRVEQAARDVFGSYGYGEIRLPIFEPTELFARSVGTDTDIVTKEMFPVGKTILNERRSHFIEKIASGHFGAVYIDSTGEWEENLEGEFRSLSLFMEDVKAAHEVGDIPRDAYNIQVLQDLEQLVSEALVNIATLSSFFEHNVEGPLVTLLSKLRLPASWSLRPEATASAVRAYIEHGMHTRPGNVKLYYMGPMFRYERQQKGRYRQFYQIGVELLGQSDHAAIDAEVIEMLMAFFEEIELKGTALSINSIGDKNCRPQYVERLREELRKVKDQLGPDSQRRIETNTLRVLDSKAPDEQAIIAKLPRIADCLCDACREHYAELKRQLALRNIDYQENWRLVRGLDYYMRTTFEVAATGLGSQDAVCGGGRYDGLVEQLGGPAGTKGIGFAIGTDRVILSLEQAAENKPRAGVDVFLAWMGQAAYPSAVQLARKLRQQGTSVEIPAAEMKFGKSLNLADRLGAQYAVIIGENELASGEFTVKRLADGDQKKLPESDLLTYLLPRTQ